VAMFCRYDEAGHFLYMFLLGAYAQRFQEVVMHVLPRWLRGGRLPTLGLAAMVLPGFWTLEHHPGADASISLGAVALVLWLARPSRGAARWSWPWRALRGCGQVAYSFYLCHFVVLYAVAWSAQGWLPGALLVTAPLAVLVGVAAVALPMAMLLALALYAGVERPSSRLGRRVARWIVGRRGAAGVPQPAPRRGSFSIRARKASTRRPDDGSPEGR
jgi:peptidoglycan/LPS O-acetylase OafA/YrhL